MCYVHDIYPLSDWNKKAHPAQQGRLIIGTINIENLDRGIVGLTISAVITTPPRKELKPEFIDMLIRWVEAGMPETVDEAAALSVEAAPEVEGEVVETPAP